MKLTIIETGRQPVSIAAHWPSWPTMFQTLLTPFLPGWHYETVALCAGEPLPDPVDLNAIVITGSPAGIHDNLDWIPDLTSFIRRAAEARIPQAGICFGHQAIAHALGGCVEKSEKGWGIGRHCYDIIAPQDWMGTLAPQTFSLATSHQDQVKIPPPNAVTVARNAFTPHAVLACPEMATISFQAHPEFSRDFVRALYDTRKGTALTVEQVRAATDSLDTPVDNTLVGKWIATFFQDNVTKKGLL